MVFTDLFAILDFRCNANVENRGIDSAGASLLHNFYKGRKSYTRAYVITQQSSGRRKEGFGALYLKLTIFPSPAECSTISGLVRSIIVGSRGNKAIFSMRPVNFSFNSCFG